MCEITVESKTRVTEHGRAVLYESVLQRELDGLDDEFSVLKFLSQELQVRANNIRNQRFLEKKAA